jgi:peptidoglycan/xylan/chitin deacetylase (PgdA/CDA1 family)
MPHGTRVIVTTSWDDGHPLDLKLADLLAERGIAGTFYVSPRNRERPTLTAADLQELAERFEIGAHSLTHPDLRRLGADDLRTEVAGSRRELEDVLGRPVEMFCYPKGRANARVRRAVAEAGFVGARTTWTLRLEPFPDPMRMPTTMRACDFPGRIWFAHAVRSRSIVGVALILGRGRGKPWGELARLLFDRALARGGVWHLWGHSWETDERGLWDELGRVLDHVAGRNDVAYATNREALQTA